MYLYLSGREEWPFPALLFILPPQILLITCTDPEKTGPTAQKNIFQLNKSKQ